MLRGVPEHCCQSYLWEQSVRDNVTDNKISEQVGRFLTTRNVTVILSNPFRTYAYSVYNLFTVLMLSSTSFTTIS